MAAIGQSTRNYSIFCLVRCVNGAVNRLSVKYRFDAAAVIHGPHVCGRLYGVDNAAVTTTGKININPLIATYNILISD